MPKKNHGTETQTEKYEDDEAEGPWFTCPKASAPVIVTIRSGVRALPVAEADGCVDITF